MSQKRQSEDGMIGSEPNSPDEKRPRLPSLKNVIMDAWKMHAFQKFLSTLEPLIRRVVKEEVEMALRKHLSGINQTCDKQIHPSTSRTLQLKFKNKLSLPVFTGAKIEGEEGSTIEVALIDAQTGEVVNSGPESSAKVEIVVLEGDFEGDEDNWTLEEFRNNIVKEREGKRPLLTGDAFLNLKEGMGAVGELVFTDNSSWTRSRKFRLGARFVKDNCDEMRVREARTEAFMVKDHRGELYKKHYPPCLGDEVWRLEKIGKDGAFHKRLSGENINTVKDFLTLLCIDALKLKTILGTGMSAKMWEVTVDHARTCTLDNQIYLYYTPSNQQRMGVVFNIVGQALGLLSEEQYVPVDELSETKKADAQKLVKVAYDHWEEVICCDDESIMDGSSHLPAVSFPSSSAAVDSSYSSTFPSFPKPADFSFDQPSASSLDILPHILSLGGMRSLDNCTLQGMDNMDIRCDQPSTFQSQVTDPMVCDTDPLTQSFCGEHLQYFGLDAPQSPEFSLESQADLRTAVSAFLSMSARSAAAAAIDKAKTRWTMLFSLLRWRFSIRRIVASKKSGAQKMQRYASGPS